MFGSERGLNWRGGGPLGAWHLAEVGSQFPERNLDCGRSHSKFKSSSRRGFKAVVRDSGPLPPQCGDSHLLFLGPLLAGPRALAALLLDRDHEAPMLSRSLATRRPGAMGRQGHLHPPL